MGSVLKGPDPDLGRDVALKVLRDDLRDDAVMVRRFIEEAKMGGQLQHPGIVPIYELSTFADHRPFFAMKLVKGRTLAELLAERGPSGPTYKPEAPAKVLMVQPGPTNKPEAPAKPIVPLGGGTLASRELWVKRSGFVRC